MSALKASIYILWIVFWLYWLISAAGAKQGTRTRQNRLPGLLIVIVVYLLLRVFKTGDLAVHDQTVRVVGLVLLLAGLGLAVWARIHLGRNWGMPMTQKDEPELITSGPYRLVRHPIYSGILLALLGTAVATNVYLLIALVVMGAYFLYSARVEERLMIASFPAAYASYRAKSKMLIPFVL